MPASDQIFTTNVSTNPPKETAPKRLLVVEDESLIALMMAEQLVELGYTVVGPAFTISEARHLAGVASIEAALVDLNLHGVLADEIADILSRRQIPFIFITGYSDPPPGFYENVDVLHKPFQLDHLRQAVEGMLAKPPVDGRAAVAPKNS